MKKLLLPVMVILLAFSAVAQAGDDLAYYYKGRKISLPVSYDRVFIEIKQGRPMKQVRKSIALLLQVSEDSIEATGSSNRVMAKLGKNAPKQKVRASLSKLEAVPEILFSRPLFKTSSGKYSSYGKEFIVKLKGGKSFEALQNLMDATGCTLVRKYPFDMGIYILSAGIKGGYDGMLMANHFYETGLFEYAEPEMYVYNAKDQAPNDPLYPLQWAHKNAGTPAQYNGTPGVDMKIQNAWLVSMGSPSIKIGLIDDGVDLTHPDLQGNILQGFNGLTFTSNPGDGAPLTTTSAHGTNCAGIIAAVAKNGLGIAGIAPNCKIIPAVIFDGNTFLGNAAVAASFDYVRLQGADIISNSWGGGSPSNLVDDAINRAATLGRGGKGCVIFASSGNNNGAIHYPSNNPQVISVGGISMCNQRKSPTSCDGETWWGANYGSGLAVVAPATKIATTDLQGAAGYNNQPGTGGDYYQTFNGTSSSCPNAAGVMALILSFKPALTGKDAARYLFLSCNKMPGYAYGQDPANPGQQNGTWNNETGYGSINALAALQLVGGCSNPVLSAPSVVQPSCPSSLFGSITINATGVGALEFSSNGGITFQPSPIFANLAAGSYNLVVKTAASGQGCFVSYTANPVIINPANTTISTISYTGPAVAIPDNNLTGVNIPLAVSGVGTVLDDLNFRLDAAESGTCNTSSGNTNASVSHTYNGDLSFILTSPSGTSAIMISKKGGSGNNFCAVTLDDEISYNQTYIGNSGAVAGIFKPANPLSIFDGENPNGTWLLKMVDDDAGDVGFLRRFSLILTTSLPCTAPVTWYRDKDNDGYGMNSLTTVSPTKPNGYAALGNDCNDNDALINPGAAELGDGKDNNCDGQVDEGLACRKLWYIDRDNDGYGDSYITLTKWSCVKPNGYADNATDCKPNDALIFPGAPEICGDGIDNNCNGLKDEGCDQVMLTWYRDKDGDGFGISSVTLLAISKPSGYVLAGNDCNDNDLNTYPGAPELADGKDNNCDGQVDDGLACRKLWYIDRDNDGYGDAFISLTRWSCIKPNGYADNATDCKPYDAAINPGAVEICDGKDNDCDGIIDEGCSQPAIVESGKQSSVIKPMAKADENALILEVLVWPNPARDVLMVTLDKFVPNQKMELTLMQADGKVQTAQSIIPTVKGQQVSMDVSRMAAGFYLLLAKQQGMIVSKRVVIMQ